MMTEFDKFMEDYMNDNDTDFDKWADDFSKSMDAVASKKEKPVIDKFSYRGSVDSNSMLNDLDKFMNPSIPQFSNIWDFLKSKGIDKEVIEHIDLKYDNIKSTVESLSVTLVTGDLKLFENIKLKEAV